jgi:ribulose-5-phosphate 4-epimerase/fuculose-1-phosphate aldolase
MTPYTTRSAAVSAAEWEARVELAATYRLVNHNGWGEGIYNHISLRVPDAPDHFLIKRHALLYEEVTASNLLRIAISGDFDESAGVNRPGFVLHAGILEARPDINSVLHLHSRAVVAISAADTGLRMLSQYAMRFHRSIGYHDYEGITDNLEERGRINDNLGNNMALMMRNHGALTVGTSARSAFTAIKDLVEACRIQILIESTGSTAPDIDEAVCESTAKQMRKHDNGRGGDDWIANLRLLDRLDPSYKY